MKNGKYITQYRPDVKNKDKTRKMPSVKIISDLSRANFRNWHFGTQNTERYLDIMNFYSNLLKPPMVVPVFTSKITLTSRIDEAVSQLILQ